MSWSLVDYEYLLDRDDIVIINIKTKEINLEYNNHKYYLENIKTFLEGLKNTYRTDDILKKQFQVDFPRIKCYINDIKIEDFKSFYKEIGHTNFLREITMICTQSSAFPITMKLFKKYQDPEKKIHVTGCNKSSLIFNIMIYNKNHIKININKDFNIIQLDKNGDSNLLKKIISTTIVEIDKKDKDVYYRIL
jgi:hypothetical protein